MDELVEFEKNNRFEFKAKITDCFRGNPKKIPLFNKDELKDHKM